MGKIADLFVKLGLKNKEFDDGLKRSEKKVSSFSKGISKIGGLIAGAFAVSQITDFTKEVVKLSAEAEGVERAFTRIGGQDILADLQKSTRGTVSNLELMRKTVSAKQLGVPIKNLASLFEFATARAADTGESVDFLVNSIVVGIGRKSPLILDNLGISAIALKDKLDGVGLGTASVGDVAEAVGKIATEELNKIGNAATTNGQKIQSFSATWDNLKLSIGRAVTASREFGIISQLAEGLNGLLTTTNKETSKLEEGANRLFDAWDKQGKLTEDFLNERIKLLEDEASALLRSGDFANKSTRDRRKGNLELIKLLEDRLKVINKEPKANKEVADTINSIKKEIENLQTLQGDASGENLSNINKQIKALKEQKKALEELGTATITVRAAQQAPVTAATQGGIVTGVEGEGLPKTITTEGTFGQQILDDQAAFLESFRQFNADAAGLATDFIADTVEVFSAGLGELFAGDFNVEDFGKLLLQGIGNFLTMLGKMMIQFGVTALVYSTLAKALANPATAGPAAVAMIAAGAALVAIGSAIGSAASGGGGGGGGAAITTIDTRGTANTSGSLQQVEVQPVTVQVEGQIQNTVIALSSAQGQKQLDR